MPKSNDSDLRGYADDIASALRTEGGHLSIGRGGYALLCSGARLSGYDCEPIKASCICAGLPVIDSRTAAFDAVVRFAVRGPMVAVGESPSAQPYHALSYAPLTVVADTYRAARSQGSRACNGTAG
jgi:hypothetical protein